MLPEPTVMSAVSALVGALIGGGGSLASAVYTQRYQDRLQRVSREANKRASVYASFMMSASKMFLKSHVNDGFTLNGDEQHLIALVNRMRLFAPPEIIEAAEAVIRKVVEISLQPSIDLKQLTMEDVARYSEADLLLPFSLACRADLDNLHRTQA